MPTPEVLAAGQVLAGKYRVDRRLGGGGMSAVYRGFHLGLEQPIAIKVLLPRLAANAQYLTRFVREAKAAAKLRGNHVGRVLDVGTDGAAFIVMELLEGEDLAALLARRGTFEIAEAVDYIIQACDGLARAHAANIIHRDVKPGNLFLTHADGEPCVKVIDFGVAKQIEEEQTQLTNTSEIFGSPQYMSPEQVRASKNVGPRSDVWSLGCVLYEFLAGAAPFVSPSIMTLTSLILSEPAPPLRKRRADVPPDLEAIILKCLEKDPQKRHASVIDLAIALAPFGRPNLNGRIVDSLRRLKIGDATPAPVRRSVPSLSAVAPPKKKKALSPKVIVVTGAATFALVLLIAFFVDRALHR
jgi:serine/threonine-protein kinase